MFSLSSQSKFWTFASEEQLQELRIEKNAKFIETHGGNLSLKEQTGYFLSSDEEHIFLKQWEIYLNDFCRRFDPPMPKCVVGTAFHYFKRFYLYNSVMDYHPKEILTTCVYLACKVEEFNVSIGQFVGNLKGDRSKAVNIILSNELLLMQKLNYYLTIHNPFRPLEGFLIDIKSRSEMANPERLRPHIDEFIDQTFFTDACLLYSPSQIALAAILHAASKEQENLDSYVTENLFLSSRDKLPIIIDSVRKIRYLVKTIVQPNKDAVKHIERKLDVCRNQDNNIDSEAYKERMRRLFAEDDMDLPIHTIYHVGLDSSAEMSMLNTSQ
ncbi:cyclin-H-like [Teleopsis dalmanni]|uniref:cyclin-H-like n=1 Tax=Teleopsis dalmanni TaxID=139649 RepID=UPI0018CD572F|nr:cyclin-H-like [Teleopsis dalmanni]XP_037950181.1 cyclin-H-like [Teleopsis dalmanni]